MLLGQRACFITLVDRFRDRRKILAFSPLGPNVLKGVHNLLRESQLLLVNLFLLHMLSALLSVPLGNACLKCLAAKMVVFVIHILSIFAIMAFA